MPSSIVLAVGCGGDNKKYFYDLLDPENPCITPAKMKKLQDRLKVEKEAQNLVVKKGSKDLEKGVIDLPVYNKVLDYLQNNSVTEDIDTESGARLQLGASGQQTRLKTYHRKSADYQEILKRLH